MAKFNNKEGHWYTTENGQHYFVENGQTPQEGWEATKRRKGINNGKYLISEDEGYSFKETDKDTYDKYEAEDAEFDPFEDDDFEIDEDAGWDAILEKFNYKDENLKPTLEESKEYAYEVYKDVSGKEPDEDTKYSIDRVVTESFYKKQLEAEGQGKSRVYTDINKAIVMGDYDEALESLEYQMEDAKKGFSDLKEDEYNELKEKINKAKEKELAKGNPYNPEKLPDEGLSQEELDNYKIDKNGNKYLEFNSEKEAKDYFNNNDLPDETVMYGNKIYFGKQKNKSDFATYNGAEVIGGDDDISNILKDETPLTKEESKKLSEENNSGKELAKRVAKAFKGESGPFGGEDPIVRGNEVTFYSQGGDETYRFNDDGSIDWLNVEDAVDAWIQDNEIEEDERDEAIKEFSHFNSFQDLANSGLTRFIDLDNKTMNKILGFKNKIKR